MTLVEISKVLRALRAAVAVIEEAPLTASLFPSHDFLRIAISEKYGSDCLAGLESRQHSIWRCLEVFTILEVLDNALAAIDDAAVIDSAVLDIHDQRLPEKFRAALAEYRRLQPA